MAEQTNEELNQDPFIADVRNWSLMESEALDFLNEGEIESIRQTATAFIDNSCKDFGSRYAKEVIEHEERKRRETLAFVFKPEFEKAPLEEQKRLIEEACLKASKYSALQNETWRKFESAKTFDELKRAGREADELVVEMGLRAFHEGKTFFQQAQVKINGRVRKAMHIKRKKGELK